MIRQLVSGCQAGVDRAGLNAAMDVGIPIAGSREQAVMTGSTTYLPKTFNLLIEFD